jgi:YrbI family 3-deoxy-D-manno-octulosonate 8-phosphate phosphatase
MSDYAALIPLRGGSKSIPGKNIKLIGGKPLCAWVLEAARASGIFSRIVVSTDSCAIADTVRSLKLGVEILERPAELATDTASTESVMLHAAKEIPFDTLVTIQATSPLVEGADFLAARELFEARGLDSLLTGVRVKRFFWDDSGSALNYQPQSRPRRQDFDGVLMENGAFYFTRRNVLESLGCRLGGKIGLYEMAPETAEEIDEPKDWDAIERLLLARKKKAQRELLAGIRLLVLDVDGTLTDAGMYYSPDGDLLKKFNTRDAKGLELVRNCGVEVALLTSEDSPIVRARAGKLKISRCLTGIVEKGEALAELCAEAGVALGEVAYMGDDVNDLDCLRMAGFPACPGDAVQAVKDAVLHVSGCAGGEGAVRELCEMIMEARR